MEEAKARGFDNLKWLPFTWCCQLIQSARDEGFIDSETAKEAVLRELLEIRRQCGNLLHWHQYNVPLVYTQVSLTVTELHFLPIALIWGDVQ